MVALAINGVEIPIQPTAGRGVVEIGDKGRAFDGSLWSGVRRRKSAWTGLRSTPVTVATAAYYQALIEGRGYSWGFETDVYSDQGLAPSVTGGAVRSTADYKYGAASLKLPAAAAGTNKVTWSVGVDTAWSLCLWRKLGSAAWEFYTQFSNGDYYDGGGSGSATAWAAISAGTLTLDCVAGDDSYIDNVWYLPSMPPTSALRDAMHLAYNSMGAALPACPRVYVSGGLLPAATSVVGTVTGSEMMQGTLSGSWAVGEMLGFDLEEAT